MDAFYLSQKLLRVPLTDKLVSGRHMVTLGAIAIGLVRAWMMGDALLVVKDGYGFVVGDFDLLPVKR